MKEIPLKILSLFLALLIVLYVYTGKKMVFFRDVPIDFLNLPPEKVIVESSAFSVKIKMSGSKRVLETVKPSIRAEVDLSDAKDGLNIIEITSKNIKVPPYVKILSVIPQSIEVKVEPIIKKSLPVMVKISSDEDYVVANLKTVPSEVVVEFPKGYEVKEDAIRVELEKKCDREGNFVYQTPVSLGSENLLTISPPKIKVKWICEKKLEELTLQKVPVQIANKREGVKYFLKPDRIDLKIRGWSKDLKRMDLKKEIRATVKVEDYPPGTYKVEPEIQLPEGIELIEGENQKLELVVR
jgi:YbbR domain-containing protein